MGRSIAYRIEVIASIIIVVVTSMIALGFANLMLWVRIVCIVIATLQSFVLGISLAHNAGKFGGDL